MKDQYQQAQDHQQGQLGDQSGEESGEAARGGDIDLGYSGVDRKEFGLDADTDEHGEEGAQT